MSAGTLAEQLDRLGCPNASALGRDLDVKPAGELEVRDRAGYGALVGTLCGPVEVWHR